MNCFFMQLSGRSKLIIMVEPCHVSVHIVHDVARDARIVVLSTSDDMAMELCTERG